MEIGTLKELNVKPGDVVQCASKFPHTITRIEDGDVFGIYGEDGGEYSLGDATPWRIISRAPQSPVRTVTRKEIVPGVYGMVTVENRFGGCRLAFPCDNFFCAENAYELRAAAETLIQIADALES